MGPLTGVTVLDISRLLPGGYASLLLLDLGARVIKIEQPGVGDYYRAFKNDSEADVLGGRQVHLLNHGKESLGLDLKSEDGREIFKKLVSKADAVIESFRPGILKRLKIDYNVLKKVNPRLILCSISGAGQTGPLSHLAAHDLNILGLSGLLLKIRDYSGRPVVPDFQMVDLTVGQTAARLIAAALYARTRTKRGCWIDCSLKETAYAMARLYPPRRRSLLGGSQMRYGIYETSDGRFVTLAAMEPKFWEKFCRVTGHPEWRHDPLISDKEDPEKREEMRKIFLSKTFEEWKEIGQKEDICLFPVEETPPHLFEGRVFPRLGFHTDKILRSLKFRRRQILDLKKKGVVE